MAINGLWGWEESKKKVRRQEAETGPGGHSVSQLTVSCGFVFAF